MIRRIQAWWEHLGYSNGRVNDAGTMRTWGIRPWRGAPFFWFVIDRSNTAVQSTKHVAACEECRVRHVPTPCPRCRGTRRIDDGRGPSDCYVCATPKKSEGA